jgi:MoaA/NifB/PqqE/SkfB family radical SAM enzyme
MLNQKTIDSLRNLDSYEKDVAISIDAATQKTYSKVRGGNIDVVIDNIKLIKSLGWARWIGCNFVIQRANLFEMEDFVVLFKNTLNCNIRFDCLANWYTTTEDEYKANAVHLRENPFYDDFLSIVSDINIKYQIDIRKFIYV